MTGMGFINGNPDNIAARQIKTKTHMPGFGIETGCVSPGGGKIDSGYLAHVCFSLVLFSALVRWRRAEDSIF
jgi:hypothetical protein